MTYNYSLLQFNEQSKQSSGAYTVYDAQSGRIMTSFCVGSLKKIHTLESLSELLNTIRNLNL